MTDRIVIAGGGTGGHVFPGLAIADAMKALADVDVVFVGSPRGLEKISCRGAATGSRCSRSSPSRAEA